MRVILVTIVVISFVSSVFAMPRSSNDKNEFISSSTILSKPSLLHPLCYFVSMQRFDFVLQSRGLRIIKFQVKAAPGYHRAQAKKASKVQITGGLQIWFLFSCNLPTLEPACENGGHPPGCCENGSRSPYCCENESVSPFCCENGSPSPFCCLNGSFKRNCSWATFCFPIARHDFGSLIINVEIAQLGL